VSPIFFSRSTDIRINRLRNRPFFGRRASQSSGPFRWRGSPSALVLLAFVCKYGGITKRSNMTLTRFVTTDYSKWRPSSDSASASSSFFPALLTSWTAEAGEDLDFYQDTFYEMQRKPKENILNYAFRLKTIYKSFCPRTNSNHLRIKCLSYVFSAKKMCTRSPATATKNGALHRSFHSKNV